MNELAQFSLKFRQHIPLSRHVDTALMLLFILSISGCASEGNLKPNLKPIDLTRLESGTSLLQTQHSDVAQMQDWWSAWQDPQLTVLMSMLVETSPSIQLAQTRLDRALSVSDLSRVDRQLETTVTGSMTADRYPEHYTYPDPYAGKTGSSGSLLGSLRWRLDIWGKWKALDQAAASHAQAAALELNDARLTLQIAVASSYMQWHAAEQKQHNQLQQRQVLQRLLDIAQLKRRAGLVEQSSVIQAQLKLTELDRKRPEIQQQIQRQQHAIAALLGQTPAFSARLTKPKLKTFSHLKVQSTLPLHWVGQRPDVAASRQRVEAHIHATDATRASFYPDIDLTAVVGLQSLGLNHLFKSGSRSMTIGPAFNLPLFEQNRLRAELKGKLADYDAAVAQYNKNLITAIQQVADDLAQLNSVSQQRRWAAQALDQQQQLLKIKTQLLQKGLATEQARLEVEFAQLGTAADLIQADQQIALAQIALTGSLGGQWAFSLGSLKAKNND